MANLTRQMNRVVETFGPEQVRAWVHANLSGPSAYALSMYNDAARPSTNRVLLSSTPAAELRPAGAAKPKRPARVLFQREPDSDDGDDDEAAPARAAPDGKRASVAAQKPDEPRKLPVKKRPPPPEEPARGFLSTIDISAANIKW